MKRCKYCNEELLSKRSDTLFCDVICRTNQCKNIKKNRIYLLKRPGEFRISLRKADHFGVINHPNAEKIVDDFGYIWHSDDDKLIQLLNL